VYCNLTCNNRKASLKFLLSTIQHGQLSAEKNLVRASTNFGVRDILPFVRCDHPPITSPSATVSTFMLDLGATRRNNKYLISTTKRSLPTREEIVCSLWRENFCPGNKYEVTMTLKSNTPTTLHRHAIRQKQLTLLAPCSSHDSAFSSVIPPPICNPPKP
jgi:hypothetical protein